MQQPNTQINGGPYTCAFCHHPFREQRYACQDADDHEPVWFCLPECLAGYEWYVRGRNCEPDADREQCKRDITEAFGRQVYPSPLSCYVGNEKRERHQWLEQECWSRLTCERDKQKVQQELLVFNNGSE